MEKFFTTSAGAGAGAAPDVNTRYFLTLVQTMDDYKTIEDFYKENKSKIDVNFQDEAGDCPIIAAARRNNTKIVEFLAAEGACMTVKDGLGLGLIDWATAHKNAAMEAIIKKYTSSSTMSSSKTG
jgi:ankyrin repeat protein